MRIYIPLDPSDLRTDVSPRLVHAVTPQLKSAVPREDAEGWEMIATLAAADDSLRRLSDSREELITSRRRIVCVAEVPDSALEVADELPTARQLLEPVSWDDVVAILVDEPGSERVVERALAGDEKAFMASGDIDLLWYDAIEREALASELFG